MEELTKFVSGQFKNKVMERSYRDILKTDDGKLNEEEEALLSAVSLTYFRGVPCRGGATGCQVCRLIR